MWIRWWLHCILKGCYIIIEVGPCKNASIRKRVIDRLIDNPKEFGMRVTGKQATGKYTRLKREMIAKWAEDEEPDTEAVLSSLQKKLNTLHANTKGIADALRPIIEAWDKNK